MFGVQSTNRKAESILDSAVVKFKKRGRRHLPIPLVDDPRFYPELKDIKMVHYQQNRLIIKDKVIKDQRPKNNNAFANIAVECAIQLALHIFQQCINSAC